MDASSGPRNSIAAVAQPVQPPLWDVGNAVEMNRHERGASEWEGPLPPTSMMGKEQSFINQQARNTFVTRIRLELSPD